MNIKTLYKQLCRKSFHVKPFKVKVRFKKLEGLLALTDYWEAPDEKISGLRIQVHKRLHFSRNLVAQSLIHEIAHVVSRQSNHNSKFYKIYFKAAQTKFGRRFF